MRSGFSLTPQTICCMLIVLPATALGQAGLRTVPIPRDPFELGTGQMQSADSAAGRDAVVQLLARARNAYALRNYRRPWDLKVHFTVDSQGQTAHDGDWEMEDVFALGQGLHWTALSASGYAVTGIFGTDEAWADAPASAIPLRLQEARATLYNPLPSVAYANSGSIRTLAATFRGQALTCVLLARSGSGTHPTTQRGWEESEDCIDPQSGLLQIHSEVPGRYAVYDYTNAPRLGSHTLPRSVTITEGGRVVSRISVDGLQAIPSPDPTFFIPTDAMKAQGPAVTMTAATRISRIQGEGPLTPGMTIHPVVVFGMVTPGGRLAEAHSLQPSDPHSDAALHDAQSIDFSPSIPAGGRRQQHFVFVMEKFLSVQ
jgi:hypothetical protein